MSLTSNLKDKNSLIKQLFDNNFNKINSFLKEENEKIKNLTPLLPTNEYNHYPYATIGHITEYVLALKLGLNIVDLFPMHYLSQLNNTEFEKIKSMNITSSLLDTEALEEIISTHLYRLAVYEGDLRSKGLNGAYFNNNLKFYGIPTNDVINIYKKSLVNFPINKEYIYNPTFDPKLSSYIGGADADLCTTNDPTGNCLIDLKTTKINKIDKSWIYQLLGYVALDSENRYNIKKIAIYLPRQNKYLEYIIEDIIKECSSFSCADEFYNIFRMTIMLQTFPQLLNRV